MPNDGFRFRRRDHGHDPVVAPPPHAPVQALAPAQIAPGVVLDQADLIYEALQRLYGHQVQLSHPEQLYAIQVVLDGVTDLVYVAPTGSGKRAVMLAVSGKSDLHGCVGKTNVFLVAAMLRPLRTVVVVVPYVALCDDLARRLRAVPNLKLGIWPDASPCELLLVSLELVEMAALSGMLRLLGRVNCELTLTCFVF